MQGIKKIEFRLLVIDLFAAVLAATLSFIEKKWYNQ